MKVYKRDQPLPQIQEERNLEEGKPIEIVTIPQPTRRFVDPCELLFKPLLGEFLGTLFLDFFASQLLFFASENFVLIALCTGLLRYTLMYVFSDCCSGEFNPALTIGKLFCLERSLLVSLTLMAGQFFGAFIGEILFAAVRPATVQVFPFVFFNESDAYADRLPPSFQSYFLIELINTSLFVVTYLRTEHFGCMAAVTIIAMTLAYNIGLETRATGNFALIFAHSVAGTLWHSPTDPWRYVEAAVAASFIAPFIAAVLYWLLRSANDMKNADEESIT